MFLQLYHANGGSQGYDQAAPYLEAHPVQLSFLIDRFWSLRDRGMFPLDPTPTISSFPFYEGIGQEPAYLALPAAHFLGPNQNLNHLIYAYLIENTRVYEIVEKVIFEYFHGEKLGFPARPHMETALWLRATEELFYKSSSNYLIQSAVTNIRPDIRASRRNAYYRLFGMDLNHGTGGKAQYAYHKPAAANFDFVPLFEEFLSEVWIGITNSTNITGANPTDDSKMRDLLRRIQELLRTRKQSGNLAREEFTHVATMSWLHLTLLVDDAPVVQDMGIHADSPAERLRQMGERVGFPAHPKADAFFKMAEELSAILTCIEQFDVEAQAPPPSLSPQDFYAPNPPGAVRTLRDCAETVITQWSIASGKDLKSLKVRPSAIGMSAQSSVGVPVRRSSEVPVP